MSNIEDIKTKTYKELSDEDVDLINSIVKSNGLSLKQINRVFISYLFDETIEQGFKKIINGVEE